MGKALKVSFVTGLLLMSLVERDKFDHMDPPPPRLCRLVSPVDERIVDCVVLA